MIDNSTIAKRLLDLLESVYLRVWKIVVVRIDGMDNGDGDGLTVFNFVLHAVQIAYF